MTKALSDGLEYNYCALAICIITDWEPEKAFFKLENRKVNSDDVEMMVCLKETMTYKQIGEIYGMSDGAAEKRINRYLKKRVAG